ncbi:hypothetical protein ACVWYF_004423 [Hymenobacter sp. UYAg731]
MRFFYVVPATVAGLLLLAGTSRAQSLASGFMSGKGHGSVVISATTESFDKEYLGPQKVDGVPIFKRIQINSLSLYANYGLTNRLEAAVVLPYVRATGEADAATFTTQGISPATNVRSNLQDISGLLKFKVLSRELGGGLLDLLGAVTASTPVGDYKSDQSPAYILAIGNRATKVSALGIAHFKTVSGVFATGQAGYSLRSGKVPNAFLSEAKLGYAGRRIYLEGFASFQVSDASGTDINDPNFNYDFTATRVNYARVGISAFRSIAKGVGLTVGASQYVTGRNIGQSTAFSAGLAYSF